MTGRELAWRVFAQELGASSEEEKGSGEKSPSYVVSPLGARMNRVLLAGTIAPPDQTGVDPNAGFFRSRLTDPTGTVGVTAGSFQPRAQAELQRVSVPTAVLVVGKAALFRGSGAAPVASIRAESIRAVSAEEHRAVIAEAASQTLERLELVLLLRSAPTPTDDELTRAGVPPTWIRGARTSLLRYPAIDPTPYFQSLGIVLHALDASVPLQIPAGSSAPPAETTTGVIRVLHPPGVPARPAAPAGLTALEGRLLEILDELVEVSPDGYADMDDLSEGAARHGIDGERMEELLNFLSEKGTLEEPLVGKFRRADGPPRE